VANPSPALAPLGPTRTGVFVGGTTTAHALPERLPLQGFFAPTQTGYIAKFDAQGSQMLWSTYVGDARPYSVSGLVVDAAGNVTFSGQTLDPRAAIGSTSLFTGSDILFASLGPGDPVPSVTLDSVINTASRGTTALAPGALFTVRGSGFDASPVRVWFDDDPVTPLQSATGELVVKAPPSIAGKNVVMVHVDAAGVASNSMVMPVAVAAPALYTVDASGVGQAVAFNEDGSANSVTNPTARGSTVTILLNGVADLPFNVSITLGAQLVTAQVVGDMTRVSVRVPDISTQAPLLFCPVTVEAGGVRSQPAVFVVVK
jgi:uncharacterized protein (TIGR03437 family)